MMQKSFVTRDTGNCSCRKDQGGLGNLLSLSRNIQQVPLYISLTLCLPRASFHHYKNTRLSSGMSTTPASRDRTGQGSLFRKLALESSEASHHSIICGLINPLGHGLYCVASLK